MDPYQDSFGAFGNASPKIADGWILQCQERLVPYLSSFAKILPWVLNYLCEFYHKISRIICARLLTGLRPFSKVSEFLSFISLENSSDARRLYKAPLFPSFSNHFSKHSNLVLARPRKQL